LHTTNSDGAFFTTVLSTSIWYSSLQPRHIFSYKHFLHFVNAQQNWQRETKNNEKQSRSNY